MKAFNSSNAAPTVSSVGPLLSWWRDLPALGFTPGHAEALRLDLAKRKMPGEIKWRAARQGDAAAAIAIAMRTIRADGAPPERLDIAMSGLLLCALDGDPAAREMLIFGLRRLFVPAGDLLADSWRAAPAFEKRRIQSLSNRRWRRFAYRPRHHRISACRR